MAEVKKEERKPIAEVAAAEGVPLEAVRLYLSKGDMALRGPRWERVAPIDAVRAAVCKAACAVAGVKPEDVEAVDRSPTAITLHYRQRGSIVTVEVPM
jgi:hypothetical protein